MTDYDLGKVVGDAGAKGDKGDTGDTGNGIASIRKTSTSGLVDTYTLTFTNGNTTTFTVTNGSDASVTIVTSFSGTTSDSKVPSEKLTKTELDKKISTSSTSGLVKNDGSIDTSTYLTSSALSNYVQKSNTNGLLKNDGTVDTSSYITSSAITGMLTSSDIADNLTTNDSTKVLSAKQGKVLNDMIGSAITYIIGSGS